MTQAADGSPIPAASDPVAPHARRRKRRRASAWQMRLNLTAMIDVVFLLLIYFVVTAGFAKQEGVLTANLPGGPTRRDPLAVPPQKLMIHLSAVGHAGCRITLDGKAVHSFTALATTLGAIEYDPAHGHDSGVYRPSNPLVIAPGGKVRWQHVVNAFNAAVRERYTNVAFAQAKRRARH